MSLNQLYLNKRKSGMPLVRLESLKVDSNFDIPNGSISLSELESTGSVGFLHDDSTDIIRKNIEIADLQNIGSLATDNSFLRHNAGLISFEEIPSLQLSAFADYEIDQTLMPYNMPNTGVNNLSVLRSTISNNFSLIANTTIRPSLPGIYKMSIFINGDLSMSTSFRFTLKNASFTFAQCIITNGTGATQARNLSMTKIVDLSGIEPENDIFLEIERISGIGTFVLQNVNSFNINLIKIG